MAFEATKREWSELYTFFRLLADGTVATARIDNTSHTEDKYPIVYIQREEHDGTRRYYIQETEVLIQGENIDQRVPREDFAIVADLILEAMRTTQENDVSATEEIEAFLDAVAIYDLATHTEDRTDMFICFYNAEMPPIGMVVHSLIGGATMPLLDGGRSANFKFEQTGVKFPSPTVHKINCEGGEEDVMARMLMIERLGGALKYNDVADKIFRSNLSLIDLHAGRLFGEMVRCMWVEGITKVSELTEALKTLNPLKIKEELISKHGYYEYKVKELLLALVQGMRPAKLYNGRETAIGGMLILTGKGEVLCLNKWNRQHWADYLYHNTRLLKGSTEKDKYGYLEKENGVYYFKLNLKIGLVKR